MASFLSPPPSPKRSCSALGRRCGVTTPLLVGDDTAIESMAAFRQCYAAGLPAADMVANYPAFISGLAQRCTFMDEAFESELESVCVYARRIHEFHLYLQQLLADAAPMLQTKSVKTPEDFAVAFERLVRSNRSAPSVWWSTFVFQLSRLTICVYKGPVMDAFRSMVEAAMFAAMYVSTMHAKLSATAAKVCKDPAEEEEKGGEVV